jgi:uncharacterized protein
MKALLLTVTALLLGACASAPVTRLHSLLPPPAATGTSASAAAAPALPGWELASVTLPAQVDQPQWLVRLADDSLVLLEHERWVAPLGDEIRSALTSQMSAALATLPPGPRWRVNLDVTRLDAMLARFSRWEVTWTLQRAGAAQPTLHCRAAFEQAATGGLAALAVAHRANVARLGDVLAADIKRVWATPEGAHADCVAR